MTRYLLPVLCLSLVHCGGALSAPHPEPSRAGGAEGSATLEPIDEIGDAANTTFVVHVVDVGTGLGVFVEGPDFRLIYDAGSNDDTAIGERNRFVAYLHAVAQGVEE